MLEDLGNLGDFVGGIAVVVTLIYLATQIRQNTAAVQAASRQEVASGMRAVYRLSMDPDAARTFAEGVREYPDMPFNERSRFGFMFTDHALFFQGVFALYESGQLEEATYRGYLDWFACNVATPGGAAWWEEIGRPFYVPRMVEAVDERLTEGGLPDITQLGFLRLDEAAAAEA